MAKKRRIEHIKKYVFRILLLLNYLLRCRIKNKALFCEFWRTSTTEQQWFGTVLNNEALSPTHNKNTLVFNVTNKDN